MKSKFLLFVLFSLTLAGYSALAQGQGRGGYKPIGKITGKVIAKDSKKPLPYSTLVLHAERDSSIVTGAIANNDGTFIIDKVPYGKFYLEVKFVGYTKKHIRNLMILPKQPKIEMGVIDLSESISTTEDVVVSGEKNHVEFKIDKKIVNVAKDPSSAGKNAAEALENVPSVQVDIDGNVSLRGSQNFTVFVNGRPSPLSGSEALKQLPADIIENIEIITNPSAKYDPDGVGGIINVVLKDDFDAGVNGMTNMSLGSKDKYNWDGLLNWQDKDWNFFIGGGINDNKYSGDGEGETEYFMQDYTNYINTFGTGSHGYANYNFKTGFGYSFTESTSLNADFNIGQMDISRTNRSELEQWSTLNQDKIYRTNLGDASRIRDYYQINADLLHKFDDEGHEIKLQSSYYKRDSDINDMKNNFFTDSNYEILDQNPDKFRTSEVDDEYNLTNKIDYTLPLSPEMKLEAGYQMKLSQEDDVYAFSNYNYDTEEWVDDTRFTNDLLFDRNIQSLYSTFGYQMGDLGLQLGLRGEYTYREMALERTDTSFSLDRFDLFPTLHASYQLGNQYQVQAGYSRRVNRPHPSQLDPFMMYWNENNYVQGNPELEPEYSDSYELNFIKNWSTAYASVQGFYRRTTNKISRYTTALDTIKNINLHSSRNLNEDRAMGADFSVNYRPAKWANINLGATVYHYEIDGEFISDSVETSTNSWNARLNTIFMFSQTTRFQVNMFYMAPQISSQGEVDEFFTLSASIRQDFFDRTLSLTLHVQDIIGSMKREFTQITDTFRSHSVFNRESPMVYLSASYRFNNYQAKQRRQGNDVEVMDFGY